MLPRECDREIMNSPPTEVEVDQGWRKLCPNGEIQGRTKYAFQCLKCFHVFANHRNANQHLSTCPVNHPRKQRNSILSFLAPLEHKMPQDKNEALEALIELIATHNVPYTQLNSPQWRRFISCLDPSFVVPSTETLNKMIRGYADKLEKRSYADLRGTSVGLCIDGAGFSIKKYYAVVLINGTKARIARVYHVKEQTADALAEIVADVYKKASLNMVTITGTCSDNAKNLVAALSGNNDLSVQKSDVTYSAFHVRPIHHNCQSLTLETLMEGLTKSLEMQFHFLCTLIREIQVSGII